VTSQSDRILSEFIDAWNAGERPDVDDYLARVPEDERGRLADDLIAFLSFAPTPEYSEAAMEAIRAEPWLAAARERADERGGVLAALLSGFRTRFGMSTADVASDLVVKLGLSKQQEPKTAAYLERLEHGELEPSRVSWRVFDALASILRLRRDELEGAGDVTSWHSLRAPAAAPVFRAERAAARDVAEDLDVLADALASPGGEERDEVDDLFLGGR
jgi:hypothetical protein